MIYTKTVLFSYKNLLAIFIACYVAPGNEAKNVLQQYLKIQTTMDLHGHSEGKCIGHHGFNPSGEASR